MTKAITKVIKYILTLCLTISVTNTYAQENTDSLIRIINKELKDTNFVNACFQVSGIMMESDLQQAMVYAEKGAETADLIGFKIGEANCLNNIGMCLMYSDEFEEAKKHLSRSLELSKELNYVDGICNSLNNLGAIELYYGNYEKSIEYFNKSLGPTILKQDTVNLTITLMNISVAYFYQGKYAKSIEYSERALKLCIAIDDKPRIVTCMMGIGGVHAKQGNYEDAERYFNEALVISSDLKDYISIANCYKNIATIYNDQKEYDNALEEYNKALDIYNQYDLIAEKTSCLNNMANAYYNKKEFDLAIDYYNEVLLLSEPLNLLREISYSLSGLAYTYYMIKNYDLAIYYAGRSLETGKTINSWEIIRDSYEVLFLTNREIEDYENAFMYHVLYKETCDSLYNIETRRIVNKLEAKYENEKKQKEIIQLNEANKIQNLKFEKEQNAKKVQQYVFMISIIIMLLTFIILYMRYKNKKNQAITKMQKTHFKEIIEAEDKERKRIASDLHDSIGMMLATAKLNLTELKDSVEYTNQEDKEILQNVLKIIDETSKDVRTISHTMMPGVLRELGVFAAIKELIKKINSSQKIQAELKNECEEDCFNETSQIAIYKIMQEVLSNVIKHSNASRISISFEKVKQNVELTIIDNGIGINIIDIEKSAGIGWKNIYSRVSILNAQIEILSNKARGSKIKIIIPLK